MLKYDLLYVKTIEYDYLSHNYQCRTVFSGVRQPCKISLSHGITNDTSSQLFYMICFRDDKKRGYVCKRKKKESEFRCEFMHDMNI